MTVCFCARLPRLNARTKVVFLQHLRERRMPIGTARMAHLALPNSELHVGLRFEGDPRVEALAEDPHAFLLFPGEGATEVEDLPQGALRTLVVVDGTWPLAKKLIRVNPILQRLPKVSFRPERPGNYRIRKEPAEHCLATIEAVAEVLGRLEGDPERFRQLLSPFDWMVDTQLHHQAVRQGPSRHVKRRPAGPSVAQKVSAELRARQGELVLVYAESNAVPQGPTGRQHELIHLVAARPATGERFEALMAPEAALDETAPFHLELSAELILAGERRETALLRWQRFLRPADVLAGWGYFTQALVAPHSAQREFVDLRQRLVRAWRRNPGGLDEAAGEGPRAAWAQGRAGRRIAALEQVLGALCQPER